MTMFPSHGSKKIARLLKQAITLEYSCSTAVLHRQLFVKKTENMEEVPVYTGDVPPNGKLIRYPTSFFTPGQEFRRFFRTSVRHFDLWPMVGVISGFVADRSKKIPPWDWSRTRDHYMSLPTRLMKKQYLYDNFNKCGGQILKLEDELLELREKYLAEHSK
ncbi:putative methyl-accepting chemotaxis AlkN [Trichinella pseudospiralis]